MTLLSTCTQSRCKPGAPNVLVTRSNKSVASGSELHFCHLLPWLVKETLIIPAQPPGVCPTLMLQA